MQTDIGKHYNFSLKLLLPVGKVILTWIPRNEAVLYLVKLFHLSRLLTNLSWCFSFAVTSRRHISLFRQIHSSFPCRSCCLLHGKIVIFTISDKFASIFSSLPFFYCVHFWAYRKALLLLTEYEIFCETAEQTDFSRSARFVHKFA